MSKLEFVERARQSLARITKWFPVIQQTMLTSMVYSVGYGIAAIRRDLDMATQILFWGALIQVALPVMLGLALGSKSDPFGQPTAHHVFDWLVNVVHVLGYGVALVLHQHEVAILILFWASVIHVVLPVILPSARRLAEMQLLQRVAVTTAALLLYREWFPDTQTSLEPPWVRKNTQTFVQFIDPDDDQR